MLSTAYMWWFQCSCWCGCCCCVTVTSHESRLYSNCNDVMHLVSYIKSSSGLFKAQISDFGLLNQLSCRWHVPVERGSADLSHICTVCHADLVPRVRFARRGVEAVTLFQNKSVWTGPLRTESLVGPEAPAEDRWSFLQSFINKWQINVQWQVCLSRMISLFIPDHTLPMH